MHFNKKTALALAALLPAMASAQPDCDQPDYLNTELPAEQRADDLLHHLTLEEKIQLMTDVSEGIDRLGIKRYNWWNEALHGVARSDRKSVV